MRGVHGWLHKEGGGWSAACAEPLRRPRPHHPLLPALRSQMAAQPPWDTKMDPYYILHYTYGNDYTKEGVFTPGEGAETAECSV